MIVKFLIIRFSSIGDIVLTSPVARILKQQVEGTEIHYLVKKQFASILKSNPHIDKVHEFTGNFKETVNLLKAEGFHYIIDLHNNIRSHRIIYRLKLISFSFKKLNWQKWLLVNFKINKLPDVHIVDRYLDTTKLFDGENDNKGLEYFIPPEEEVNIASLPANFKNEFVAFVIGAKHYTKQLPIEKIIAICKKIDSPIILLGGKEDIEKGESIKNEIVNNILNACGKYTINQSASLVKQSKAVITHDTGLMHIAAAFKKKIISIWGNTIPEFGMYPYLPGEGSKIIQVDGLKCRPCSKIGHDKCPKKHFKCMMDIDVDEIISALI